MTCSVHWITDFFGSFSVFYLEVVSTEVFFGVGVKSGCFSSFFTIIVPGVLSVEIHFGVPNLKVRVSSSFSSDIIAITIFKGHVRESYSLVVGLHAWSKAGILHICEIEMTGTKVLEQIIIQCCIICIFAMIPKNLI